MPDRNYFMITVSHVDNHDGHAEHTPGRGKAVQAMVAVPHPGPGGGGRGGRGGRGRTVGTGKLRSWTVVPGPSTDTYLVTDHGARGIEIAHKGAVVWTGYRTPEGYQTNSTSVHPGKLEKLLATARAGDDAAPAAPAEPSAAPRVRTPRAPKAKAEAASRDHATPRAKADPAPKAKATDAGPATERAPGSGKRATGKPDRAKRPRKGADEKQAAGSRAGNAPAQAVGSVQMPDDNTVLAGVLAKVQEADPKTAAQTFKALRHIWLAGGREKTIAWMKKHGHNDAVEAFDKWVNANMAQAQKLLKKPARAA